MTIREDFNARHKTVYHSSTGGLTLHRISEKHQRRKNTKTMIHKAQYNTETTIPRCLAGLHRLLDGPDRDVRLRTATLEADIHTLQLFNPSNCSGIRWLHL